MGMFDTITKVAKHAMRPAHYGEGIWTPEKGSFYSLRAKNIDGVEESLEKYKGNVSLVINVACACGYTKPTYTFLTNLYNKYHDQGFEVLAFPCNQFGNQESGTEEQIKEYVKRFDVKFPIFAKIDVNGPNTHPVYQFLKSSFKGNDDITWNFASSFIINRDGVPIKRFGKEPHEEVEAFVANELKSTSSNVNTSGQATLPTAAQ